MPILSANRNLDPRAQAEIESLAWDHKAKMCPTCFHPTSPFDRAIMRKCRRDVRRMALFLLATASGRGETSALQPKISEIECPSGFLGVGCRPCGEDLYSSECSEPCEMMTTCSGHGRCVGSTGQCNCFNGWSGEFCNVPTSKQCSDGYSRAECQTCYENAYSSECSLPCDMLSSCSGHGRCNGSTGKCLSDEDSPTLLLAYSLACSLWRARSDTELAYTPCLLLHPLWLPNPPSLLSRPRVHARFLFVSHLTRHALVPSPLDFHTSAH